MQTNKLVWLPLLAALYAGQALAAEAAVAVEKAAPAAEKTVPAAKPKAVKHKHKKDCVEPDGKPCHLRKQADKAATAKPAAQDNKPVDAIKAAVPAATKPEVKADSALSEADALALAKKSNCLACHAIGKKVIGPGWKDVAAKYRGDADAEARLIARVAKGGRGAWGSLPMPANSPSVSDADIKTLVKFILSLK